MRKYYIGIDDHKESCTIAVRDETGKVVVVESLPTDMGHLRRFIESLKGRCHVAIEVGQRARWLLIGLRPICVEVVVANANKLGQTRKEKGDRVDALELAELLRLGFLKPVYLHTCDQDQNLKELVRCYEQMTGNGARARNRIKSIFLGEGIRLRGTKVYSPRHRQEWLEKLPMPAKRFRAELFMKELDEVKEHKAKASREMLAAARQRPVEYGLLRTLPQIGPIRAALLLGYIGDPHRFPNKRALWKMCGLAVVTRSSGEYQVGRDGLSLVRRQNRVRTRGLNQDFNPTLKYVFRSAVEKAVHHEFKEEYEKRVAAGMRPEMAKLTLTRKLVAITLACWKKGEPYLSDYSNPR